MRTIYDIKISEASSLNLCSRNLDGKCFRSVLNWRRFYSILFSKAVDGSSGGKAATFSSLKFTYREKMASAKVSGRSRTEQCFPQKNIAWNQFFCRKENNSKRFWKKEEYCYLLNPLLLTYVSIYKNFKNFQFKHFSIIWKCQSTVRRGYFRKNEQSRPSVRVSQFLRKVIRALKKKRRIKFFFFFFSFEARGSELISGSNPPTVTIYEILTEAMIKFSSARKKKNKVWKSTPCILIGKIKVLTGTYFSGGTEFRSCT